MLFFIHTDNIILSSYDNISELYHLKRKIDSDDGKEYRDTMQEVMLELKLKAGKVLKALENENKNNKIKYDKINF